MIVIKSKQNPIVKELASLKEKKGRRERGTFLVEGRKMVRECIESGLEVVRLVVSEGYEWETFALPVVMLGADAFAAICDEKTPQGIVAEVNIPKFPLVAPNGRCLFLDGVSDPANVGAILRTAAAAGYREIYLADCADPYSPKCVRSSMSGVFYAKLMRGTRAEILCKLENIPKIAADMNGEDIFTFQQPETFCLCIGNEGNGLSEETRAAANFTVGIPMDGRVESLNAAVSASILMYLLRK